MNKILNLFDKTYVRGLFIEKILPLFPEYKDIKQISLLPIKKDVWTTTYHVVIECRVVFSSQGDRLVELPIFCTAHSSEPRINSFAALSFLWQAGFEQNGLIVPRPLFFSDEFNGSFYRGVLGQTLYYHLKNKNYGVIEDAVQKTAAWFAKLHNTPIAGAKNFNPENSRIETVIPGLNNVLEKINQACPRYFEPCQKIYEIIERKEKEYFSTVNKLYLIHGDAHPKNVIRTSQGRIALIDFTDMCLADFTRDLGSFLQQLDFMASNKIKNPAFIEKIKNLFLENYILNSKMEIDGYAKDRIKNYYNWTALRTATFFMLKDKAEPERAHGLLVKVCQDLKIKTKV